MCPFCSLQMEEKLSRHLIVHHRGEMADPAERSAAGITKIVVEMRKRGVRLVTVDHVVKVVGRTLWDDRESRGRIFRLLQSVQVELWSGDWALERAGKPTDLVAAYRRDNDESSGTEDEDQAVENMDGVTEEEEADIVSPTADLTVDSLRPRATLIRALAEDGLQERLEEDHPLLRMYGDALLVTHSTQPAARKNYLMTVSRVLRYVRDYLVRQQRRPSHWVELLHAPEAVIEYLQRRSEAGASEATCLAYLKAIRPVYEKAHGIFAYQDPTFPRETVGGGRDAPDSDALARVKMSMAVLNDFFRGTGKRSVSEMFKRKVADIQPVEMMLVLI